MAVFPRLDDDELVFRLIRPGAVNRNGTLSRAVFSDSSPPSVYVKSLMPGNDGERLHIGKFKHYGRGLVSVGLIRSVRKPGEIDVRLTGEAESPHEAFCDAHAEVMGPTKNAAKRLKNALVEHGKIEKLPPEHLWGT